MTKYSVLKLNNSNYRSNFEITTDMNAINYNILSYRTSLCFVML